MRHSPLKLTRMPLLPSPRFAGRAGGRGMRGDIPVKAKDFSTIQRWRNNEHRNLPNGGKDFCTPT